MPACPYSSSLPPPLPATLTFGVPVRVQIGPRDVMERVREHARSRGDQRLRAWAAGLGSGIGEPHPGTP